MPSRAPKTLLAQARGCVRRGNRLAAIDPNASFMNTSVSTENDLLHVEQYASSWSCTASSAAVGRDEITSVSRGSAIQWGVMGAIVLYAMWCSHLLLFRQASLAAWIGLVVVVQNIVSSILNSHLFDFHEGWMYVLGVGIAGGVVGQARRAVSAQRPRQPAA